MAAILPYSSHAKLQMYAEILTTAVHIQRNIDHDNHNLICNSQITNPYFELFISKRYVINKKIGWVH